MRPMGVESKKDIFAKTTDLNILLCQSTDFLTEKNENSVPRVITPIINRPIVPPYTPTNTSLVISA